MSEMRAILTTSRRELSLGFFFLQGKAPKEIQAILTKTLDFFLPGQAKDLSAPLYCMESTICDRIDHVSTTEHSWYCILWHQFKAAFCNTKYLLLNVWTVAELQIRKYMEGSGCDITEVVSPHFPTADEKPSVKNEDNLDNKKRNRKV